MYFKGSHILKAMDQECDYYNKSKNGKQKCKMKPFWILCFKKQHFKIL